MSLGGCICMCIRGNVEFVAAGVEAICHLMYTGPGLAIRLFDDLRLIILCQERMETQHIAISVSQRVSSIL